MRPDQPAGFGDGDEIVGGENLVLVVAQPRHRLVEAHLALRQRHHRLQIDIEPVFLDGVLHRGEQLRLAARGEAASAAAAALPAAAARALATAAGVPRRDRRSLRGSAAACRPERGGAAAAPRGQHILMARHRDRELLDQHAEFVDLADHGLDAVGAGRIRRHHPALDRGEPAAEFGDLAGEVGGAARQIGDLAADVGAVAQPHRHGVVEDQEGQRGQRHDRGFRAADAGHRIQDEAERGCDQHHADGDENRRNANHVARYALKSELSHPGKHGEFQARSVSRSPKRCDLSINVDSQG